MRGILFLLLTVLSLQSLGAESYLMEFSGKWNGTRAILLTGFGPFAGVPNNPSGRIVHTLRSAIQKKCGLGSNFKSLLLPVQPGIISKALKNEDLIISVGVAGLSDSIRVEQYARNIYTDPDTAVSTIINPARPLGEAQQGSLVPTSFESKVGEFQVVLGDETSAGTYVCNDTYYRLIDTGKRAYFIHIPNVEPAQDQALVQTLSELSCAIFELQ